MLACLGYSYATFKPPDGFWNVLVQDGENLDQNLVKSVGIDLYGVLRLSDEATDDDIHDAHEQWFVRIRELGEIEDQYGTGHGGLQDHEREELAQERTRAEAVKLAYSILGDEDSRDSYDELRSRYRSQRIPMLLTATSNIVGIKASLFLSVVAVEHSAVVLAWTASAALAWLFGGSGRWRYLLMFVGVGLGQFFVSRYVMMNPTQIECRIEYTAYPGYGFEFPTNLRVSKGARIVAGTALVAVTLGGLVLKLAVVGVLRVRCSRGTFLINTGSWVCSTLFVSGALFLLANLITFDQADFHVPTWEQFGFEFVAHGVSYILSNLLVSRGHLMTMLVWGTQLVLDEAPGAPKRSLKNTVQQLGYFELPQNKLTAEEREFIEKYRAQAHDDFTFPKHTLLTMRDVRSIAKKVHAIEVLNPQRYNEINWLSTCSFDGFDRFEDEDGGGTQTDVRIHKVGDVQDGLRLGSFYAWEGYAQAVSLDSPAVTGSGADEWIRVDRTLLEALRKVPKRSLQATANVGKHQDRWAAL